MNTSIDLRNGTRAKVVVATLEAGVAESDSSFAIDAGSDIMCG